MDDENVLINLWEDKYETYTKSKKESGIRRKAPEYLNRKKPPQDYTYRYTEQ